MPAFARSDPPFNYMDLTIVFVVSLLPLVVHSQRSLGFESGRPLERQADVT